ncbi:MAG TPA: hypothetical protein VGK16_09170, partial [Candidatus Limnocylindrales bacterium]
MALIVALAIAPAGVLAVDPSPDPSASPTASAVPSPSADPTASPDPSLSSDPSLAPDPTPEPTVAPTPTDAPAPTDTPAPTADPTAAPSDPAPSDPAPAAAATITSDKADYAPGELVTLAGAGWQPGESVHIFVNDDWGSSWSRNVDVTADDAGAITDQFNLPGWFVAVYSVVATGAESGVIRYSFTDSQPQTPTLTNTSVTVGPGGTADYGTLSVPFNGSSTSCTVTLAIDPLNPLPSGATAVFGATSLASTGAIQTITFSVTTSGAIASGSTSFRIGATRGALCQGNGTEYVSATLVVARRVGTVTVAAQNGSLTFSTAGSATYQVTVNRNGTGGGAFGADLTISTALPSGVTAAFTNATLSFLATDNAKTTTLTLTTTAAAAAGTTAFTVLATNPAIRGDASSAPGSLVINKASSTTTVTCPANVTYTGSPLTPCPATVTGDGGLGQVLSVTYGNNTNAGLASASASYTGDANHTGSTDSRTFTIDKASSLTTVTCPTNVTYTGSAQTPCSASVTGAGSLSQTVTVTYSNNADAGSATAAAFYAGDANHTGSSDSKTFTIDKASSTTTVSCTAGPFTYTGSAQTPCSVTVIGTGGLNLTPDPDYTRNTNAGTATASYTYTGDANHTGSTDSKTFTIDKASSSVSINCPASVIYNGSAQEPCTAIVTRVGAGTLGLTVGYSTNTSAGTANASASYPGDANHSGDSTSTTFTIDKASSLTTVTCTAGPFTYTGSALTPCSASVTGAGGLSLTPTPGY